MTSIDFQKLSKIFLTSPEEVIRFEFKLTPELLKNLEQTKQEKIIKTYYKPLFNINSVKFIKYESDEPNQDPYIQFKEAINKFKYIETTYTRTIEKIIQTNIDDMKELRKKKFTKTYCKPLHDHYSYYLITKDENSVPSKLVIELQRDYQFDVKEAEKVLNKITGVDLSIISIIKKEYFDVTNTPQVSLFSNEIYNKVYNDELVWLDKYDGLRTLLIFRDHKIYTYRSVEGAKELNIKYDGTNTYIVESEYIEKENKYKIFEVYVANNKDVRILKYQDRLASFDLHITPFEVANYSKIENWNKLIEYSQVKHEGTDGIIIQLTIPFDIKTFGTKISPFYCYKLKPYYWNTIDFLVRKTQDIYRLYLTGSAHTINKNMKWRPRTDKVSMDLFEYNTKELDYTKKYMVLFDSPVIENLWYYKPEEGDIPIKDEDIVEMAPRKFSDTKINWKPMKIRSDKLNPNGYNVGLTTTNLLFSPLVADKVYFNNIKETPETIAYHKVTRLIRQYEVDKVKKDFLQSVQYIKCCDICGGRGGSAKNLYDIGVNMIINIDQDKESIVTYQHRITELYIKPKKDSLITKHIIDTGYIPKNLTVTYNGVYADLNKGFGALKKELIRREEFKEHYLDYINCQYAIHYMNKPETIKELSKLFKYMLNDDGIVMFAYFDADRIISAKGKFKKCDIKYEKIGDRYEAEMYAPTFNESGYQHEPLIFEKDIREGFKDEFDILETSHPTDYTKLSLEVDNITTDYSDYLNCIAMTVLKVKHN